MLAEKQKNLKKYTEKELDNYIKTESLDFLINFDENKDYIEGVYDSVSNSLDIPFPPVKQDLVNLHKHIREHHFFTILEFGVGYSTIIMADALRKNKLDFEKLNPTPQIRNRYKFKIFSVDTSKKWINFSKKRIPNNLKPFVNISYSLCTMNILNSQICSLYNNLPDIIPDFIYLDGPNPREVKGEINGMSFKNCLERTVISGDLLLMESSMLPGTNIWVDGRVNNVRFLENNFKRKFEKFEYPDLDITLFQLNEKRLGKYNILGSDLF